MPARVNKIRHDEETRAKIQAAQIINRMHKCFMGDLDLTVVQVSIGKTLLAKVLPDLASVSMDGKVEHTADDTLAALLKDIAANGSRIHD